MLSVNLNNKDVFPVPLSPSIMILYIAAICDDFTLSGSSVTRDLMNFFLSLFDITSLVCFNSSDSALSLEESRNYYVYIKIISSIIILLFIIYFFLINSKC